MLKDLGRQLHPHADVHLVVDELNAHVLALIGEPLGAGPAGRGNEVGAVHRVAIGGSQAVALVPQALDFGHRGAEAELHPLLGGLIDALEDLQVVLRAQVLAAGLEQVEVVLQGLLLQGPGLGGGGGVDLGGGAVLDVDGVHVVDEVHDLLGVHKVGEPAAEGGGEVVLAVREGARAAEAAHGVADFAVDALLHLARHDGAAAAVDVGALVQCHYLEAGVPEHQLVAGENARLAAAQNGNVIP